ncbi:MAG TPA: hypothetical protein VMT16_03590 [Thermoanaerobaculia bacterium]|nr:hypothetical protein [Thermoanaerobaculia bacterium]
MRHRTTWFALLLLAAFGATAPLAAQDDDDEFAEDYEEFDTGELGDEEMGDEILPGMGVTDSFGQMDEILEGEEEILAGGGYSYDPAGRRDPFVSLLRRTRLPASAEPRPEGVPGLLIGEVSIKGIFELNGRMFAQVQVSNKDTSYLVQEGDQLYDGEVVTISPNEVVFKQMVNDPSIIKPFREVAKRLNPEP